VSRWFRHYAGMMRDEKLVRVAIKSKQPVERVLWIWGAILESAAEIDDNGRYDLDPAEVAYFLRADEDDVGAVFTALADAGRVADNSVVHWGDRQFTSDKSKERQAAYRERKRQQKSDGDHQPANDDANVTSPPATGDGDVTAQETETETETEELSSKDDCASGDALTLEEVAEDWNAMAESVGLPLVRKLTPSRRRQFKVRLREYRDIEDWQRAFKTIRETPWMHGDNARGWRADFDFLLQSKSFTKLTEGAYGQANR
jgi:hypothetical protein